MELIIKPILQTDGSKNFNVILLGSPIDRERVDFAIVGDEDKALEFADTISAALEAFTLESAEVTTG